MYRWNFFKYSISFSITVNFVLIVKPWRTKALLQLGEESYGDVSTLTIEINPLLTNSSQKSWQFSPQSFYFRSFLEPWSPPNITTHLLAWSFTTSLIWRRCSLSPQAPIPFSIISCYLKKKQINLNAFCRFYVQTPMGQRGGDSKMLSPLTQAFGNPSLKELLP